jgi:hypothetical protein
METWTTWINIGDGIEAAQEYLPVKGQLCNDVRVSAPAEGADDSDVRRLLCEHYGDDWMRASEWSSASGEGDITSSWKRVKR